MLKEVSRIVGQITVEPLLFGGSLFILLYAIVVDQFIFHETAVKYDYNSTEPKCGENSSDLLYNKVTKESSKWLLYCNIAGFSTSFIFTPIITSWGDRVGRKPPLVFVFIGFFFFISITIVTVSMKLPLYWLIVARLVCGLGGDFSALLACCYAYLSDVSTRHNRTMRLMVGEAFMGLGGIIGNMISGPWINSKGFESPLWLLLALTVVSLLYITTLLNESTNLGHSKGVIENTKSFLNCQSFRNVHSLLSENKVLAGIFVCMFLQTVTYDGVLDVMTIYQKSPPLCWTTSLVGYSQSILVSTSLVGLVVMKLTKDKLSQFTLFTIGIMSEVTVMLFFAITTVTWLLFLGLVLGSLTSLVIVIMRSVLSIQTTKENHGTVFALNSMITSVASLVASFLFNGLLTVVTSYKQIVFLLAALMYSMVFIVYWILKKNTNMDKINQTEVYDNLFEQVDESSS